MFIDLWEQCGFIYKKKKYSACVPCGLPTAAWAVDIVSLLCLKYGIIVQFSLATQSCPTLCDPIDCSTPGLPVRHQLPEFTQTHVHWVNDAIQPSPPLSSPSPPTFSFSQHQGLFQWVSSSHQVAKILEFQLQHQPFQWIFKADFLQDGLIGSPCSPMDSQESPPIQRVNASILWCSAFFIVQLSHPYMTTGKTIALTRWTFVGKVMTAF